MVALLSFFLTLLASPFKPKSRLEAENAALRHQLAVLQRKVRGRVQFTNSDRLFFILLYRRFPSILNAITIIRPETVVRWHRAGFRRYWRWKSRCVGGRPQIDAGLRALIRRMSVENRLWGAPHIHGELLKLGFEVAQSTVAKYMAKGQDPSSQGWGTFLRNHAPHIAAMDLFVVPTIGLNLLYVLVIVRLARRELVWINVAAHPTAEWIAQQITEAFPLTKAPRYLIRDRDGVYGAAVTRRLRAMGIRDKPIAPGSPWQNGFAERLIGSSLPTLRVNQWVRFAPLSANAARVLGLEAGQPGFVMELCGYTLRSTTILPMSFFRAIFRTVCCRALTAVEICWASDVNDRSRARAVAAQCNWIHATVLCWSDIDI